MKTTKSKNIKVLINKSLNYQKDNNPIELSFWNTNSLLGYIYTCNKIAYY